MSLVGTRPPTVDEWDKYELHHRARLATKPGLTGMWQVSGRSNITDLEETNNKIRGLDNGFQRGYTTLKKLRKMGMKDVGFGMTVQDANCKDLVPLYEISNKMGMEFATASLHNSFYFVEAKNIIHNRPMVAKQFENLVNKLLNRGQLSEHRGIARNPLF